MALVAPVSVCKQTFHTFSVSFCSLALLVLFSPFSPLCFFSSHSRPFATIPAILLAANFFLPSDFPYKKTKMKNHTPPSIWKWRFHWFQFDRNVFQIENQIALAAHYMHRLVSESKQIKMTTMTAKQRAHMQDKKNRTPPNNK